MFIEVCKGEMTMSGICFTIFCQEKKVFDEASVTKFWELQNLGSGGSLYYFPHFCEYLKISIDFNLYKIEEFSNNEAPPFFLLNRLY